MLTYVRKLGFTIIELIVVITIMAVLLSLGFVNLRSTIVTSRDQQRATDVNNFRLALESFYKTGYSGSTAYNRYPSLDQLNNGATSLKTILPGFDNKNLIAPDMTVVTDTLVLATNNTETTTGVTPQPTVNQYVYQPLTKDEVLCSTVSQQCQKFNIYYRQESDNTVIMVQSLNQ